jgi:formamidopyrimidine-DNA glycosylase
LLLGLKLAKAEANMPELPEVETVRRGLTPAMQGRRIERVEQNRPNLRFPFPDRFVERLQGQVVERLDRRAKYLLIRLSGGETLLSHLGMSGRFTIETGDAIPRPELIHASPANPKHDHAVLYLQGDVVIRYNDPRRFGFMTLFDSEDEDEVSFLADLGPEPNSNEFSSVVLGAALRSKKAPIKMALLDQRVVAGLGNIYVCEALHRSGISPRRESRTIPGTRAERLAVAVRDVINEAIEAGGSSLKDFASTDGALGYFQHRFRVYGREGDACVTEGCDGEIKRIVQSARSTFYCSKCQR